jgi:hypothetical protein
LFFFCVMLSRLESHQTEIGCRGLESMASKASPNASAGRAVGGAVPGALARRAANEAVSSVGTVDQGTSRLLVR